MAASGPASIELFATYIHHERGLSARTAGEYSADMRDFARFLGKTTTDKQLLRATRADVGRYVQTLMGKRKYTAAAVKRRIASIRAFYKYARLTNLISENVLADFPAPKGGRHLPKVLSEREMTKFLSAKVHADDEIMYARDHAIFELMYAAGLRIGELVGLDIRDVDRERRLMRVTGKGNKQRLVLFN